MAEIEIKWNAEGWILNSQEEIDELLRDAPDGEGCKTCDTKVSERGPWGQIKCGEIFCWDCALSISNELPDVEIRIILTADQIRSQMEWLAAGIGIN